MNKLSVISALFVLLIFSSCNKDEKQLEKDIVLIERYLNENSLTAQRTNSGLHYIITVEGAGVNPAANSMVEVRYKGYFLDNIIFDETAGNQTVELSLNNVIKGWQEGLQLFNEGGSGTLLVPSTLGYGRNPPAGIPQNAVLIFDIDLVRVR